MKRLKEIAAFVETFFSKGRIYSQWRFKQEEKRVGAFVVSRQRFPRKSMGRTGYIAFLKLVHPPYNFIIRGICE